MELRSKIFYGLGLAGIVIAYIGLRHWNGSTSWYVVLVGLAILAVFGVYRLQLYFRVNNLKRRAETKFREFLDRADRITVDLDQVEIRSNKWEEREVIYEGGYSGLDGLSRRPDRNTRLVERSQNHLSVEVQYNGRRRLVQAEVEMDTTALKMLLAVQKQTTLYVNPDNPDEYYLDLDFLNA